MNRSFKAAQSFSIQRNYLPPRGGGSSWLGTKVVGSARRASRFTRQAAVVAITTALLVGGAEAVRGQSPLDGFDPNVNGEVYVVVVQPDGKILVGGDFTTLSPSGGAAVTRLDIARLNADGTLDTAFDPGVNGSVQTIALQPDGKILIGGSFTILSYGNSVNGSTAAYARNNIARLHPDGSFDFGFNPNANLLVRSIAVQSDGKILAGGNFTSIGGQARNLIARLDATTGQADSFNPNANQTGDVRSITVQPDGRILAGGNFTSIGGQTRNRIARLDPTTGLADSFDPNASNAVYSIAVQSDGEILAGGIFTSIGGQARNRVARLDPTTGLADSFNPNANTAVLRIAVQPDGKILAGGNFTNIGGQARNYIARLDPTTGLADSFDPDANSVVYSIAAQSDGKILAGGFFTSVSPNGGGAVTRNRIARLETDGRLDQTLNLGIAGSTGGNGNNLVTAIAVQPDGKILIGGIFSSVLGVTRNNIARLNTDGTLDTAFNPNANNVVWAIAVQADGKILASGGFTSIGGQARNCIARLDPTTGLADSFDPNANTGVYSIAVQSDGKILAGGLFTSIGGQTRNRIARLDSTTGLADSFDPNANSVVYSIAVQSDGKILAAGNFTSIGGQTRNRIARLDGATGAADSWDPSATEVVVSIAVQADGKVLAGGGFAGANSIGGQTRNRIARLDGVTGAADSWNPNANQQVVSIAVQADGKILAGGSFFGVNSIGGQTRNCIARLDATTGLADSWGPNVNSTVYAIAAQADGKILAGGVFTSIDGQPRNNFARLSNDTAALQNLAVTQSAIIWTRGGSSPQLRRVTFEQSPDGVNYTFLGNGIASGSDWTLTGLSFATGQNVYIRARGYYRSGEYNGSESITESVRDAHVPTPPTVQFSASAYNVNEGGSATVSITVTRIGNTTGASSVQYATSNGTAVAGSDYTATSGTVNFAANETTKDFTVAIIDDTVYENTESLSVALSAPSGATLGSPSSATIEISDRDAPPQFAFAVNSITVGEAAGTATLTVVKSGATQLSAAVNYATSDGTATAGSDYTATSGSLIFTPNQTTTTLSIPITDDTVTDPNESFTVALSAPVSATLGAPDSATVEIIDDDKGSTPTPTPTATPPPTVQFSQNAYSATEPSATLTVTAVRTGNTAGTSTVNYATANFTATAGADYTATSGTLTFAANQLSETFTIPVANDAIYEGDETFSVTLSAPVGATLGSPTVANVTIVDDEKMPTLSFANTSAIVNESAGTVTLTIVKTGATQLSSAVQFTTSNGTATAASDYTLTFGTPIFAPNVTSATITVPIIDDTATEGAETFKVTLSNPTNASVGAANQATITIPANDTPPPPPLVCIDYVTVGNPGNANDPATGFGSVPYSYRIGKYEITNAQYTAFLNKVDPSGVRTNPQGDLYNSSMTSDVHGGIVLSPGAASGSKYSVKPGYADLPVAWVSFVNAMQFSNWLHNGQSGGGTQTGSYTLFPTASSALAPRNLGATVWVPSENEWYKAAYHQPASLGGPPDNYWFYPTKANGLPTSMPPNGNISNSANFFSPSSGYAKTGVTTFDPGYLYLTEVGAYSAAASFYGTFDQAGNVWEKTEALDLPGNRLSLGGSWLSGFIGASTHVSHSPNGKYRDFGFRVASKVPSITPIITSGGTKTGFASSLFQFQLTAGGVTSAAFFTATGLPGGLTLNPGSGLISGTPTTAGTFPVIVTLHDGCATATQTLLLTFTSNGGFPVLTGPTQAGLIPGKWFSYTIPPPGDGSGGRVTFALTGQLPAGLTFDSGTGVISGIYNPGGKRLSANNQNDAEKASYSGGNSTDVNQLGGAGGSVVSNVELSATNSFGTDTMQLSFVLAPPPAALNISTRATVGTGDNVLIGGFIITGDAPKKVIIRAISPSIAVGGTPGAGTLQDTTLALYDSTGGVLQENDDWATDQQQEIADSTVPPTDPRESAIVRTLEPGPYTAVVGSKGGETGIALVEVYDLDTSNGSQLVQISTRGSVQTGDNVLIGGFIIAGDVATEVLIRAIGPGLTASNVPNALEDPMLELYDSNGALLARNDSWKSDQEQAILDTTAAPGDEREPAILRSLTAGAYTAIVRGTGNTVGVALVEVYVLQ